MMLVLRTQAGLPPETREALRDEVKKHTGEDCMILSHGVDISEIQLKRDGPLWRQLFRRGIK